jgi:hypothetical protein
MSRAVETVMTDNKSNMDLIEINKSIPFNTTTSFEKIYNEYLDTCRDKTVEFSNSTFNPDDQKSPNVFVNKLENRIKLYYNSFT